MDAEQHQVVANLLTKPTDLSHKPIVLTQWAASQWWSWIKCIECFDSWPVLTSAWSVVTVKMGWLCIKQVCEFVWWWWFCSSVQTVDSLWWQVMEQCVDEGLIRSIGLSNFNSQQIQYVIDHARIPPAVHEVRPALTWWKLHPSAVFKFVEYGLIKIIKLK